MTREERFLRMLSELDGDLIAECAPRRQIKQNGVPAAGGDTVPAQPRSVPGDMTLIQQDEDFQAGMKRYRITRAIGGIAAAFALIVCGVFLWSVFGKNTVTISPFPASGTDISLVTDAPPAENTTLNTTGTEQAPTPVTADEDGSIQQSFEVQKQWKYTKERGGGAMVPFEGVIAADGEAYSLEKYCSPESIIGSLTGHADKQEALDALLPYCFDSGSDKILNLQLLRTSVPQLTACDILKAAGSAHVYLISENFIIEELESGTLCLWKKDEEMTRLRRALEKLWDIETQWQDRYYAPQPELTVCAVADADTDEKYFKVIADTDRLDFIRERLTGEEAACCRLLTPEEERESWLPAEAMHNIYNGQGKLLIESQNPMWVYDNKCRYFGVEEGAYRCEGRNGFEYGYCTLEQLAVRFRNYLESDIAQLIEERSRPSWAAMSGELLKANEQLFDLIKLPVGSQYVKLSDGLVLEQNSEGLYNLWYRDDELTEICEAVIYLRENPERTGFLVRGENGEGLSGGSFVIRKLVVVSDYYENEDRTEYSICVVADEQYHKALRYYFEVINNINYVTLTYAEEYDTLPYQYPKKY